MSMIKIGMIGIAAVFLALLLKKEKGELALLVGIAASVLIFGYTLSRISFIPGFFTGTDGHASGRSGTFESTVKDAWNYICCRFFRIGLQGSGIWICRRTD